LAYAIGWHMSMCLAIVKKSYGNEKKDGKNIKRLIDLPGLSIII